MRSYEPAVGGGGGGGGGGGVGPRSLNIGLAFGCMSRLPPHVGVIKQLVCVHVLHC